MPDLTRTFVHAIRRGYCICVYKARNLNYLLLLMADGADIDNGLYALIDTMMERRRPYLEVGAPVFVVLFPLTSPTNPDFHPPLANAFRVTSLLGCTIVHLYYGRKKRAAVKHHQATCCPMPAPVKRLNSQR